MAHLVRRGGLRVFAVPAWGSAVSTSGNCDLETETVVPGNCSSSPHGKGERVLLAVVFGTGSMWDNVLLFWDRFYVV